MDKRNEKRKTEKGYVPIPRGVMVVFCYVLPALLVAALIAAGFWGNGNRVRAEELRRTNEGIYRQAYTELADSVYNMQIALSKLMVSESPATLSETLDDIRFESGAIAGLMGRIPQSHADSVELNRFLIQIGDYAKGLSGALRRGGRLSEEDRGQLMELFTASEAVFGEISEKLSSGSIPLSALDTNGFFDQTEQQEAGERYPAIVYDGRYSDSIENREPMGLTGEDTDGDAAHKKAREYLEDEGAALEYGGISGGKIPFHGLSGTLSDGRRAEIALSVNGGQLLYLRTENPNAQRGGEFGEKPSEEELSRLEEAGKAWLLKMGYPKMEAIGAQYYESGVLISFAAVQSARFNSSNGMRDALISEDSDMSEAINMLREDKNAGEAEETEVIIYSDLVKLWLDRGSGMVIGADANGYLHSHTERAMPSEIMVCERAAERLSKNLAIERTALALIPMPDGSEKLCHEFTGSFAGERYAVYLDAETGDEVRISRLINDENGTSVL